MDDLLQMTGEELRARRQRLEDDLADYEEMAAYHSINSPAHATATERTAAAGRLQRMKDAIAEIDGLLRTADA